MVHEDFSKLGPPPRATTQVVEWSERGQKLADAWEGRKKAKEEELKAGRYGQIHQEIKKLQKQKADLYKTPKRSELEARAKEAQKAKRIQIKGKGRASDYYKKAEEEYAAARKAVEEEKKRF